MVILPFWQSQSLLHCWHQTNLAIEIGAIVREPIFNELPTDLGLK